MALDISVPDPPFPLGCCSLGEATGIRGSSVQTSVRTVTVTQSMSERVLWCDTRVSVTALPHRACQTGFWGVTVVCLSLLHPHLAQPGIPFALEWAAAPSPGGDKGKSLCPDLRERLVRAFNPFPPRTRRARLWLGPLKTQSWRQQSHSIHLERPPPTFVSSTSAGLGLPLPVDFPHLPRCERSRAVPGRRDQLWIPGDLWQQ